MSKPPRRPSRALVEALEKRLLLSADIPGILGDSDLARQAGDAASAVSSSRIRSGFWPGNS